jgi:predicted dehydrogenase
MDTQNKIKVGLLGYGFIAKTHAPNIINNPKAQLHSIYSVPQDKEKIPAGVKFFEDWKTLIDDPEIQAVVIATPTFTHKEIALYAAKKGKHIFLEKPMARTVEDCQAIIDACDQAKVKLFLGHVLRFWPSYVQAMTMMKNKPKFGDLKYSRLRRISGKPGWASWFFDQTLSGGVMLDLAIHDLDFSIHAFGELPEKVYCEAQKINMEGKSVYALAFITLSFPNGKIGYCEASWLGTAKFPFTTETEFIGTNGIIQFQGSDMLPIHAYTNSESIVADPMVQDGYFSEMDAFFDCIRNNTEPAVSGKVGKEAVAISIAAEISADRGEPVMMKEVLK